MSSRGMNYIIVAILLGAALVILIIFIIIKKFSDSIMDATMKAELPMDSTELMLQIKSQGRSAESGSPLSESDVSTSAEDSSSTVGISPVPQTGAPEKGQQSLTQAFKGKSETVFALPYSLNMVIDPSQLKYKNTKKLLEITWDALNQPVTIFEVVKTIAVGASYAMIRMSNKDNYNMMVKLNEKDYNIWKDGLYFTVASTTMNKIINDHFKTSYLINDYCYMITATVFAHQLHDKDKMKLLVSRYFYKQLDFAKQNDSVLESFCSKNWESFLEATQECIAYTRKDFPEGPICLQYATIRLRAALHNGASDNLKREWNTFGKCCFDFGYREGCYLAAQKLKELKAEDYITEWEYPEYIELPPKNSELFK